MTPEQFAYWMQGFCELHGEPPTAEQWEMVKQHLATVFTKVTDDSTKLRPTGIFPNGFSPNHRGYLYCQSQPKICSST